MSNTRRFALGSTFHRPVKTQWVQGIALALAGTLLFTVFAVRPSTAQEVSSSQGSMAVDTLVAEARSLRKARRFDAAKARYREALALYRRQGNRAQVGAMQNEIGVLNALEDQYDEALNQLQEASATLRAAGDDEEVAKTLNNRAIVHRWAGNYEEAMEHYQEVLQMYETVGTEADRATVLYNLGLVHEDLGAYDEALEKFEKALDVYQRLEDKGGVARSHDVIGDILSRWGRYEDALGHFRKATTSFRELGQDGRLANTLNGIGNVHQARGEYTKALRKYWEALRINKKLDDQSRVAATRNYIGTVYVHQGREKEALDMLQKALEINQEAGRRPSVAINLNEIGRVYRHRGLYTEAVQVFEKALQINRSLDRAPEIARSLEELGVTRMMAEQYEGAESSLRESIQITEELLATASGEDRRDFLAKEIHRFQALVTTQIRAGRPEAALRTLERSRTRLLTERLAAKTVHGDSTVRVPRVDSLQRTIAPNEAAVLYANTDTEHPVTTFVVTRDSVEVREVSDTSILAQVVDRYEGALDRLRLQEEVPWGTQRRPLLRQAKGIEVGSESEGMLANLVRLFRHDLSVPPSRQLLSSARRDRLGQFLYSVLIEPIEERVASKDELVIVPDGALSYLPFEVLRDWDETRLIDQWRVRYVQSLRVLELLQRRRTFRAAQARRPLLAVGGVVYDSTTYTADTTGLAAPDSIWAAVRSARSGSNRGGSIVRLDTSGASFESVTRANVGRASTYRELGYGPDRWDNLPATVDEVKALGRITNSSTLLIGKGASERAIHGLSRAGILPTYRALHFATHGFAVPEDPGMSALVLSESSTWGEGPESVMGRVRTFGEGLVADGYLTMDEIAELDLNAEFVGLSACRTGLGRIYRGSGAISLAQAFFRAGAGSVAVSLWSVYDASTSRFMESVYRRAWNQETSWSEAVAQTKRAFINGHHGERLTAPRFWAPFVFYGGHAVPPSP